MRGQRRRGPPKRAPKNIFSPGAKKEQTKSPSIPPKKYPVSPPKVVAPPKVAGSDKKEKIPEKPIKTEIPEAPKEEKVLEPKKDEVEVEKSSTKEIISEQIFGNKPKKTRGLKQIKKIEEKEKNVNVQSDRAAALIEQSRQRAMQPEVNQKIQEKKLPQQVVVKKRRSPKSSYQPAARAKRLNRSRHMEYKYEMRKLLQDINVPEEHRSNLLGTIWAKGERKTATDAKEFLHEKLNEGAINEEQKSRLEEVIDDYTIRR